MMKNKKRINDSVNWFWSELTASIVAKSGVATDRFHLGKVILESLRRYPDAILQIDGGTGGAESNRSVMERSILCAIGMKNLGLREGDVIVLMAPSHLDLCIPFYAALYIGVIISAIDRTYGIKELQGSFNTSKPKMVFCQSDKAQDVQVALNEIDLSTEIITFDKGDYLCSFSDFLGNPDGVDFDEFKPSDFDAENAISILIATSGTTGLPKAAAVTHKSFTITIPHLWTRYTTFPGPTRMALIGSPLQWLTALLTFIASPIMGFIRLQTSAAVSLNHCRQLFNIYRPTWTLFSPPMMTSLIKEGDCDLSSLDTLMLGGSAVSSELIDEVKVAIPNADIFNVYGMSELVGVAFAMQEAPSGSSGKPSTAFQCRVIDLDTGNDIVEPNVPGELWIKGPAIFKEYYNNPEATADTFAEDRWFRTGDMFYRDENDFYYFVDRIKLLLKYKSHQISPVELENVIRNHPSVLDVAVTGIPDPECGELPVACVVPINGKEINPDEIKELVKDQLSESKQLRGGVFIIPKLPLTASSKINRQKLKEMAIELVENSA